MSNEDFRRGVLEVLLMIHRGQQEMRSEIKDQIGQLQQIAVQTADDVGTVRSRLIEQASRHGVEIHEHEKAIIKHDARLTRLERRIENGFDPDVVPDAE